MLTRMFPRWLIRSSLNNVLTGLINKLTRIKAQLTLRKIYDHYSPIKDVTCFFSHHTIGNCHASMEDTSWWDHIFGQIYLRRQDATKRLKLTDLPGAKAERPKVEETSQMKGPVMETRHIPPETNMEPVNHPVEKEYIIYIYIYIYIYIIFHTCIFGFHFSFFSWGGG